MSKICCIIALTLISSMAIYLYSTNDTKFLDNLSSSERYNWQLYNNKRNKQAMNALVLGLVVSAFVALVIENKSLPIP